MLFLEWFAFVGVLISTWLYGYGGIKGPIVGAVSASAFIAYGLLSNIPAAWITNLIFLCIHIRNGFKMNVPPQHKECC